MEDMANRKDIHVNAGGLTLHGTRHAGGPGTPVICLHGLTRNVRDFEDIAPLIAGTGRDVIALSMRGRGKSDYDPDYLNYHPLAYRNDVLKAMDELGIAEAVFLGTSLGGIVTMLINDAAPERVKAAMINDVGPELAPEGIARIASYVGKTSGTAASLDAAAAQIRAVNEVAFPGRDEDFWRMFARRTFRENPDGSWSLDYDPNVGKALAEVGAAPDLWAPFESLKDTPTLIIRGALSDLLSPEIVGKMRSVYPDFDFAEVPNVGHAPTLTEPAAWAAIEGFLSGIS
ncbi:alpha/beta fold hydrolase [Hyphococcus luteus]|uniref:Alpha/beta hydrolase n=1 Tax=Hyphococcus luteus TaxID=2058213 RepID=A0A2S7K5R8_9PROT|nr:alpha/beta hydrolase [Marinicaulis flavus]PQA87847.1 alpha/beta hydrolase [Marinicaulis flavus]